MKDIAKRIENDVKDCLARACTAQGIDKTEVGVSVGGGGVIAPQIMDGKIVGFAPTWMVTVSVRSLLLGQDDIAGSLPMHDVLPGRELIEATVTRLIRDVAKVRTEQFNAGAKEGSPLNV